ncbi:hypothetical protein GCM10017786_04120 [Amycolatopsis deserti]|uniref:Uncharacterized protein n=1 Tax=Amycolatopsis deserti TaxID=185696 RepID=A0ABQ3IBZ6_9PSEU|nr:hypothetical protein GCM10017786_04120 [Amycolatopsis deserti]
MQRGPVLGIAGERLVVAGEDLPDRVVGEREVGGHAAGELRADHRGDLAEAEARVERSFVGGGKRGEASGHGGSPFGTVRPVRARYVNPTPATQSAIREWLCTLVARVQQCTMI